MEEEAHCLVGGRSWCGFPSWEKGTYGRPSLHYNPQGWCVAHNSNRLARSGPTTGNYLWEGIGTRWVDHWIVQDGVAYYQGWHNGRDECILLYKLWQLQRLSAALIMMLPKGIEPKRPEEYRPVSLIVSQSFTKLLTNNKKNSTGGGRLPSQLCITKKLSRKGPHTVPRTRGPRASRWRHA